MELNFGITWLIIRSGLGLGANLGVWLLANREADPDALGVLVVSLISSLARLVLRNEFPPPVLADLLQRERPLNLLLILTK